MSILEYLQAEWVWRALAASSMVGIMCGVLGCFIVLRQMAMIGDALSHAILPGVVLAFIIMGYNVAGFFLGSVIAGIITAIGITWAQQNVKTKSDAAIGIVFTAMFALGVIGISWISKNEGVHLDLKDFLFGNVLGVSNEDLWMTLAVSAYVLLMIIIFYRHLFITSFQPTIAAAMGIPTNFVHYMIMILLSFSVVAALQTVGVILVVAMLITPASSAILWSNDLKKILWIAGFFGLLSAIVGLLLAILFDTTPGPAMAIVATLIYVGSAFIAPKKGILARYLRKRKLRRRILMEDGIKYIFRHEEKDISLNTLAKELEVSHRKAKTLLHRLLSHGLLDSAQPPFNLSPKGEILALKLIRAHRLWETYLVDEMGMDPEQIHEEAEQYEHHLSEELLDEVDRLLGSPKEDPHGSPIPSKEKE